MQVFIGLIVLAFLGFFVLLSLPLDVDELPQDAPQTHRRR